MVKQLSEAIKEVHGVLKASADSLVQQGQHQFLVEIEHINYKTYSGVYFVRAVGDSDQKIQLVIPIELVKDNGLKHRNSYEVTGHFEITKFPKYGLLQLKLTDRVLVGQSIAVETKKQLASESSRKAIWTNTRTTSNFSRAYRSLRFPSSP